MASFEGGEPVLDGASTFSKIRVWFNLDSLQQCTFDFRHTRLDHRLEPHLVDIPATVKGASLYGFKSDDFAPSVRALGRCAGLTRLVLDSANRLSLKDANPLAIFPALRELSVRRVADDSLSTLLAVPHESLQTLAVGNAEFVLRHDRIHTSHPLYVLVEDLCDGQRTDPARFPALKTVILLVERLTFGLPEHRTNAGLRETARKLRALGLELEDQDGCRWQDAWFDEPEKREEC